MDHGPRRSGELTPAELPRRIGLWPATAVVAGIIIGSGIFRTPASIAQAVDSVSLIALLWIAGGVITLCLALSLAELATSFPHAGGLYSYLREAFGPGMAFVFGWTFLVLNPSVWAAIALIFGEYAGHFVPLGDTGERLAATGLVAFVTATNYFSVRLAVAVQAVATSAKVFALAAIAAAIFTWGDGSAGAFAQPSGTASPSLGAVVGAFLAVLFSYEGIAASCAVFGEVRAPARNLPRALIVGVLTVIVLYLLVNAAYLHVLSLERIAAAPLVAAEAISLVAGAAGAAIISACVMLSTFGAVAGTALADPRVFYAMARDGLFFKGIGAIHPRHDTPHVAVLISGALACLFLWLRTFEELAAQFVLGMWPFYALAIIGLMVLRLRLPRAQRPFSVPLYPFVPVLFLLAALGLLVASFIELPLTSSINAGITLLGVPIYWLWRRLAHREAVGDRAK
jgi:basic amino acid/polyamine antiporter, APA family